MEDLLRVLYIEDDSNDRTMFGIMAEKVDSVGIWLYTLANAREAIDYLEGRGQYADRSLFQLPEVIVLDLHMPGASGFDFLEWHKSSPQFANLPVVVFSGTLRAADQQRAHDLGVAAIFEKSGDLAGWENVISEIYLLGMKRRRKHLRSPRR